MILKSRFKRYPIEEKSDNRIVEKLERKKNLRKRSKKKRFKKGLEKEFKT